MGRPQKFVTGFYGVYVGMMKIEVEKELTNRLDLIEQLGRFKKTFIGWCAKERIIYQPDIDDEVNEFINKYVKQRLYHVNNDLWKEISKDVFERDEFTCQYCGKVGGKLEVDHKIPISRGGTNDFENLTTSCRKCNRQKRDKSVEDFEKWRGSK